MAIPEHLKADFDALPNAPGCYIYKDEQDHEIYVGKARSLRKRVRQYFDDKRVRDTKTLDLVARIRKMTSSNAIPKSKRFCSKTD